MCPSTVYPTNQGVGGHAVKRPESATEEFSADIGSISLSDLAKPHQINEQSMATIIAGGFPGLRISL